ncbi:hypothetical protein Tco_0183690 [Tanacetum coccineum]
MLKLCGTEAIEKRFGGNEATKKSQRNLLKQQFENFTTPSTEMLDQTFDKLQMLLWKLLLLVIVYTAGEDNYSTNIHYYHINNNSMSMSIQKSQVHKMEKISQDDDKEIYAWAMI